MFVKLATSVLVALIAISEGTAGGVRTHGIVASWSLNISTNFYDIPQQLNTARDEGWTTVIPDDCEADEVEPLGFKGDPTFILLFKNDVLIGIQIALRAADVDNSGQPVEYGELDAITSKVYNGQLYYTGTVYFTHNKAHGTTKIAFKEKDGVLRIPTDARKLPSETAYVKGKCVPTMGYHYYTWTPETSCTALYPWAVLVTDDTVVGVAFEGLGRPVTLEGDRAWWERFPPVGLRSATDNAPTCAYDGELNYGFVSLHVWFQINPKTITC